MSALDTRETPEQAAERIASGLWIVFVDTAEGRGISIVEHAVRSQEHPATRCSLSRRMRTERPADGTRRPCGSCLRSIEVDGRYHIPPIKAPDGALALAIAERDSWRRLAGERLEKARVLSDMLLAAGVHPSTIAAVMSEVEKKHAFDQG